MWSMWSVLLVLVYDNYLCILVCAGQIMLGKNWRNLQHWPMDSVGNKVNGLEMCPISLCHHSQIWVGATVDELKYFGQCGQIMLLKIWTNIWRSLMDSVGCKITKINLRMYPYTVRVPSHESKPGLWLCILFHNSQLVFSMARKERTGWLFLRMWTRSHN